jgi:hypothetical protein
MGRHAFSALPEQARFLADRHPEIAAEGQHGLAQGWDLPFALWRSAAGFDIAYPANDHATLSVLLAGRIERRDGRFRGRDGGPSRDRFILYPGGHDRRYLARHEGRGCRLHAPPVPGRRIPAHRIVAALVAEPAQILEDPRQSHPLPARPRRVRSQQPVERLPPRPDLRLGLHAPLVGELGRPERSTLRTTFRETFSSRQISLIASF